MISLPMATPAKPRNRGKSPVMPRDELKRVTARVVAAKSLRHAADMLRAEARKTKGQWARVMRRLARGLVRIHSRPNEFHTPYSVFIAKGNTKLPFVTFSTLPQYTCPGAGECLEWCYSFTGWRTPEPWAVQLQNTLLLKFAPHVVAHAFAALDRGLTVRLYVDGDFDSAKTIDFWFRLLISRPDVNAYGYSKSWDLLWEYAQANPLPPNYRLNLSSGGKAQQVAAQQMANLSITRGEFLAVRVDYRPKGRKGRIGFERYGDPAYHRAVRKAAREQLGLDLVFGCPGKCGECASGKHACGNDNFRGVPIVNGVH